MAVKIYISGGAINIEGVYTDIQSINPAVFDWQKVSTKYIARDGIQKQDYELGIIGEIEDFDGVAYPDEATLISALNSMVGTAGSNSIDVNIQDQTTPSIEHFMWEDKNDVVINTNMVIGDNILHLDPGHLITVATGINRDYINIYYNDSTVAGDFVNNRFSQHTVVSINGDDIGITPPIAYNLDITKVTSSKKVNVNMAATIGTLALPITFEAHVPTNLQWDLTRFIADMILTSAGDDGKFGNIAGGIQNGIYFGFEGDNFTEYQLAVFDNGGWRATAYDVDYTIRSGGAGDFGMSVRKSSAGQDKLGVAIRLASITGDKFITRVQDDLTLLLRYRIKIMGHIVN